MLTFLFFEAYLLRVWQHHHRVFFLFDCVRTFFSKKGGFLRRYLLPPSPPVVTLDPELISPEIDCTTPLNKEGGVCHPEIPDSNENSTKISEEPRIGHSRADSGFAEKLFIFDLANSSSIQAMSIEEKFQAAVKVIQSLPNDGPYQPSNDTKLKFYGLFKSSTEGPCNVPKPAFYDVVGRYKWNAWKQNGNLSKEDAMARYVDGLKEIVETMSFNGDVQDFLDSIGPFYEFVNLQGPEMNHIKGKIDTLTSSSSSSTTSGRSSIVPSPINSCPNSPLRNVQDIVDGEVVHSSPVKSQDMQNGVHEKAEVQVESRTATYETSHNQTSAAASPKGSEPGDSTSTLLSHGNENMKSNGFAHEITNGETPENETSNSIASELVSKAVPPTPQHRRSSKTYQNVLQSVDETDVTVCNGSGSSDAKKMEEEDEIIQRVGPLPYQGQVTFAAQCKDDLEEASPYSSVVNANRNKRTGWVGSRDTIPSTTSGTESEKYYSGDSEPEVDERYAKFFSHQQHVLNSNPGPSSAVHHQGSPSVQNSSRSSTSKVVSNGSSTNGTVVRTRREKSSPKGSLGGLHQFLNTSPIGGDIVLHSTIERLNRDVDHILARLRILEALYASATNTENGAGRIKRRRFLDGLSNANVAFIVMWPFAVHFLIKLVSWWWRRRRMSRALVKAVVDCGSRRK